MASPGKLSPLATQPSSSLTAPTLRLRELVAKCEKRTDLRNTAQLVRRANAALEDVDSSNRTLEGLAEHATKTVDDRLVRALRSALRDAVGRADAAVKKELEKVANVLVDDVRFVFEPESADDAGIDGDEAVENCHRDLQRITADANLGGELDNFVSDFVDSRFRSYSRNIYNTMLESTTAATDHVLEARLRKISAEIEAVVGAAQATSQVPARPQPAAAARAPSQASVSPAQTGQPQAAPVPAQRQQSQSSATGPPPVARPQPDNAGTRPASEATISSQPPAAPSTKPRPKSVATSLASPMPPSRPPPPAERSPIAKARTSTDGGPHEADDSDDDPAPPKPADFSAGLNRMLSGPPPKFRRNSEQSHQEEENGEEHEAVMPPRPTARVGMVDELYEEAAREERAATPAVPATPPARFSHDEERPNLHHDEDDRPPPASQPRPTASEDNVGSEHSAASSPGVSVPGGKDKDKHKGQKSPKMGIRGMLSHLTKSRPKKAKKDGKQDEDDEPETVESKEPSTTPVPLETHAAPPAEQAAAASIVPPRPAPRPPVDRTTSYAEDDSHDLRRGHTKGASERSGHSRPGSVVNDTPLTPPLPRSDQPAVGEDSEAPPAVMPPKPRKQPNAAMSALASVMRGNQHDEPNSDGDENASVASVGSRNRTSMYSETGASAQRPMSMASQSSERPERSERIERPSSRYDASHPPTAVPSPGPVATPPRPARPVSVAVPESPSRRATQDDMNAGAPPSGTVEAPMPAPRRPPKPVQSPLAQSPVKRKSISHEDPSPSVAPAPSIPPKPAHARKSVMLDDAVSPGSTGGSHGDSPPVPVPRPRPASVVRTSADRPPSHAEQRPPSQLGNSERPQSMASLHEAASDPNGDQAEPIVEESPKPRRIPGIFSTNHGALGALAAAVNGRPERGFGRSASQEIPVDEVAEQHQTEPEHNEEGDAQEQHVTPPQPRRSATNSGSNPDLFNNPSLNFKRKEASTSGDDSAIEKAGLEWLNKHLEAQDIQVDNLFSSLGNGLNLIYALEDATGTPVGKYNKRAMLPVHKIDNLAVALNFLSRKGISTSFCSPQDIMDGDRGKILTLFNYMMKAYPL
ncbi:hypothetical protein HKX48_005730 [Thoreauomyces humboldtii]|nr:hypothetical protein HKX48_005730 [Thoreauomyces humboldtii]